MPNQLTLFPLETKQYDMWLLRELMNNCIAHSNYALGGRINVDEEEDEITLRNPVLFYLAVLKWLSKKITHLHFIEINC